MVFVKRIFVLIIPFVLAIFIHKWISKIEDRIKYKVKYSPKKDPWKDINSKQDVDLFIDKINICAEKHNTPLSNHSLELLRIISLLFLETVYLEERSVFSMMKLLKQCFAHPDYDNIIFDIIIKDNASDSLKQRYAEFLNNVWGLNSSIYQKTVKDCWDVLPTLPCKELYIQD